jgi:hypothetical protein
VAGKKYDDSPFTLFVLTMVIMDISLQTARLLAATENLPMGGIYLH